jgi:hypothetical protein
VSKNELFITPETQPFQPSLLELLVFDRFYGFNEGFIGAVGKGTGSVGRV